MLPAKVQLFCSLLHLSCLRSNSGHQQTQQYIGIKIGLFVWFALGANANYDHYDFGQMPTTPTTTLALSFGIVNFFGLRDFHNEIVFWREDPREDFSLLWI